MYRIIILTLFFIWGCGSNIEYPERIPDIISVGLKNEVKSSSISNFYIYPDTLSTPQMISIHEYNRDGFQTSIKNFVNSEMEFLMNFELDENNYIQAYVIYDEKNEEIDRQQFDANYQKEQCLSPESNDGKSKRIQFEKGRLHSVENLRNGNVSKLTTHSYNEEGLIVKTTTEWLLKNKKREQVSSHNKEGFIIKTETISYEDGERSDPSIILKFKDFEVDEQGNWIKRTIYDDDGVLRIEQRKIVYY